MESNSTETTISLLWFLEQRKKIKSKMKFIIISALLLLVCMVKLNEGGTKPKSACSKDRTQICCKGGKGGLKDCPIQKNGSKCSKNS